MQGCLSIIMCEKIKNFCLIYIIYYNYLSIRLDFLAKIKYT